MSINSTGFDTMLRTLKKKTGASYAEVIKGATGSILENAARNTKKSSTKILKEAVEEALYTRIVPSVGE